MSHGRHGAIKSCLRPANINEFLSFDNNNEFPFVWRPKDAISSFMESLALSWKKKHAVFFWLHNTPDSKDHGANMGPTWALSAPGRPHVGPMILAICDLSFWIPPRRHKIYLYFLSHSNTKKVQVFKIVPYWRQRTSLTLHNQYHGCWWPGDDRRLGIKIQSIDLVRKDYSGRRSYRVQNIVKTTCQLSLISTNYIVIWIYIHEKDVVIHSHRKTQWR